MINAITFQKSLKVPFIRLCIPAALGHFFMCIGFAVRPQVHTEFTTGQTPQNFEISF